jgi:hypothetical protein
MFFRLFYSRACEESTNLLQVIYNENIINIFILICVEDLSIKDMSNLNIDVVPSIVISADNVPSEIHQGPVACSRWLTGFTMNRRKNLAARVDQQRRIIQKAQSDARKQEDGALDYSEAEMEGVSDMYSYTGTDLCQSKNFVMVGDENKYNILTPQIVEGKVDLNTMKRQMQQIDDMRSKDTQEFMKTMEREQIRTIINHDNAL